MKYGNDLPSFSFDFSEFVSGAIIERAADSRELYLVVFMIGHEVVHEDFPFEAISTEEEVLHNWGKATKSWSSVRHGNFSNSGLYCMLHNSDPKHPNPYLVSAHWIHSDNNAFNGHFKMLKCKLRGTSFVFDEGGAVNGRSLLVDIIHKQRYHSALGQDPAASAARGIAGMSSDPQSVVISFQVPWKSRHAGYPYFSDHHREEHSLLLDNATTTLNPWRPGSAISVISDKKPKSVMACIAGIRPAHPTRAVGAPMILETVQHLLLLGVDHVFLGFQLEWKSPLMHKYLRLLRPFIDAGQLSVLSMALDGFDDVAGFGGVQFSDLYADLFFVNHCLYYAKGMADFLLTLRINEMLTPSISGTVSLRGRGPASSIERVVDAVQDFVTATHKEEYSFLKESAENALDAYHALQRNQSIMTLFTHTLHVGKAARAERLRNLVKAPPCAFQFAVLGKADPTDAFAAWGPGDSMWTEGRIARLARTLIRSEYFAKSRLIAVDHASAVLLSVRDALGVEIQHDGQSLGICAGRRAAKGMGGASSTQQSNQQQVPHSIASAVVFAEAFNGTDAAVEASIVDGVNKKISDQYAAARQSLASKGLGDIAALKALARQAMEEFSEQFSLSFKDSKHDEKVKSRASVKRPFWQPCDHHSLAEVLKRVYGAA